MSVHPSHILKYLRNFLLAIWNKQFLFFLFFFALSGIFWLLMTLNENYEEELQFPVYLTNVPKNAVITSDIKDTVKVTVYDKGFFLVSYLTSKKPKPVSINFETYANRNTGRGVVPAADVQKMVYQQLLGSSRITSVKPDKLDFYFNFGQSKQVPVTLTGNVTAAKNFYISGKRIVPQVVTIYADKKLLDSIHSVTARLSLENVDDTIMKRVELQLPRGVKAVPSTVSVRVYSDILTEESIEVPIVAVNMPEGKVLRTFPSKVTVHFTVGASAFRYIKADMFQVIADYNELVNHPSEKCNIYLRAYPHLVSKCQLDMNSVDYLIEQQ